MSEEDMEIRVHEHSVTFYIADKEGHELRDTDGNLRIFTAPDLDFVSYAYDLVEYDDLEEVK